MDGRFLHQTNCYFEHVVAEGEVGEAVPGRGCFGADALFGVAEVLLRVLV
jgi:hypothetical protein